jgi:hypothetical protein
LLPLAIYESGSVVCGILLKLRTQGLDGILTAVTRVTKLAGVDYMDIQSLANETGGEALSDKPEKLHTTFQTLINTCAAATISPLSPQTKNVTARRES